MPTELSLPKDLADAGAARLAALHGAGRACPVEAAQAVPAGTACRNPALNAFCWLDGTPTLQSARESSARCRADTGPWPDGAPAGARRRDPGAVPPGKACTPEWGCKGETMAGISRNPWHLDCTPVGAAAALPPDLIGRSDAGEVTALPPDASDSGAGLDDGIAGLRIASPRPGHVRHVGPGFDDPPDIVPGPWPAQQALADPALAAQAELGSRVGMAELHLLGPSFGDALVPSAARAFERLHPVPLAPLPGP